ncbi:MAG TPA: hypothetical protein VGD30_04075 [Telluria sp.]
MAFCPRITRTRPLATLASLTMTAALVAIHLPAAAARPARPKPEPELLDFAKVAQHRPRPCAPGTPLVAGPAGWKQAAPLCVWQGRLQMRRWVASADAVPAACTAPPAAWLAWQRARVGNPAASGAAWHAGWTSQYLAGPGADGTERIAIIERRPSVGWVATEWTWAPSPRAPTRKWQQGRWELLAKAASAARTVNAAAATPLHDAWEKNLKGRAAEVAQDGWRWQSGGACLRMTPIVRAAAPLPLPYAREDARLEQRAAMQIHLARRNPGATFLMPFRLLDAPAAAPRSGAKYAAIWTDRTQVTGQLWIPRAGDEPPIRAQVVTGLPSRYDTPAGMAAGTRALRIMERELTGIADIWSAEHER